jgi:hypothetical protein
MGISRDVHGELTVEVSPARLTPRELELLGSVEGLEAAFDELQVLPDGTFAYKGKRVLLYIRDVSMYVRKKDERPKFHLANCRTLHQMREIRRFERYVIAAKDDGRFNINWIESGQVTKKETVELSVCQNCLDMLNFDGFRLDLNRYDRQRHVSRFRIAGFFDLYPRSLHMDMPRHGEVDGPLNVYSSDFERLSHQVRADAGWTCQQCEVVLSSPEQRRFLHVHHKNGLKFDNSKGNLEVICLACHAEEPAHHHMKNLPEYQQFKQLRDRLPYRR